MNVSHAGPVEHAQYEFPENAVHQNKRKGASTFKGEFYLSHKKVTCLKFYTSFEKRRFHAQCCHSFTQALNKVIIYNDGRATETMTA